jgi:signal transduction histidine kinase
MNMNTAQNKSPSFRKNLGLSPGHRLSSSARAGRDTKRPVSGDPAWMKSPVIARATHEAGHTLYELLGMAELMRVAYEKGEMESVHNRLEILMSEAAGLALTLTNILELTNLETRRVAANYEHFDVVALLQEVAQTAKPIVGQKPVTVMDVASPNPIVILSDPIKVRQIMTGLINNAATFTDRGRIALILNKDEDRIRLTVTDTGRGMTVEQLDAVFASSDDGHDIEINGQETSGLGLRIVKHLVNLLEGSISVSSKVGEGTIVEVSLPLESAGQVAGPCCRMHKDVPIRCEGSH